MKRKDELLKLVEETTDINMYFIRQSHPKGLGDAVLTAKAFIGDEPFCGFAGWWLDARWSTVDKTIDPTVMRNWWINVSCYEVPHDQVSEYGVIDPAAQVDKGGLYRVKSFVEKPKPEDAPSDLAIIGRYLLTPEIFEELENTKPGKGNEIQLTDAIDSLNNRQHVYAHEF